MTASTSLIERLEDYERQLGLIAQRFKKNRDGIWIAEGDEQRLQLIVFELIDLYKDLADFPVYANRVSAAHQAGLSNFYSSPSLSSVEQIKTVVAASITKIRARPAEADVSKFFVADQVSFSSSTRATQAISGQPDIFVCHSSADKPFVRKLVDDLDRQNIACWLDERELKIGDRLVGKIGQALGSARYVAVIMSLSSAKSDWVQRELSETLALEIGTEKQARILPLLIDKGAVPPFLRDRLYADFSESANYKRELVKVVEAVGFVFNNQAFEARPDGANLSAATDAASAAGFRLLRRPFFRAFQYVGLEAQKALELVGGCLNEGANIVVERDEARMFLETEGNFVSYVEVELKSSGPLKETFEIDIDAALGSLSINPSEIELVRRRPGSAVLYDHARKLKVVVQVPFDGAFLSVSFGRKYYGL